MQGGGHNKRNITATQCNPTQQQHKHTASKMTRKLNQYTILLKTYEPSTGVWCVRLLYIVQVLLKGRFLTDLFMGLLIQFMYFPSVLISMFLVSFCLVFRLFCVYNSNLTTLTRVYIL